MGYHVLDAFRHKREMWHGRAQMNLEKTKTSGWFKNADGSLFHCWDSDSSDQLGFSERGEVVHSHSFGTIWYG